MYGTVEKALSRYLAPILKQNQYFTVKELEIFLELGHTAKDFYNLMEEHKQANYSNTEETARDCSSPTGTNQNSMSDTHHFAKNDSEIVIVKDEKAHYQPSEIELKIMNLLS